MPTVHLTSQRNQRAFAWTAALLADEREPTWPQIEAAVRSAAGDAGPLYLTGGEPTLRRDLFAIIERLARTFPERDLVLVTNGRVFFYERACDALAAVRAQSLAVDVWIASMRREVHDQVTGVTDSFDQASRGVQQLVARGQRTRVRVLIGRHNIDHLHEIAACIPDRFPGIAAVVWDVATCAAADGGDLGVRPDQVSSILESALNLLSQRQVDATVVGMPACAVSERYRSYLDRTVIGVLRDECAPCRVRDACAGVLGVLAADAAFHVHPIVASSPIQAAAEYERYLADLLARYVPPGARAANAVLDAMCGQSLRNLSTLRRFFPAAAVVHGTDIALDPATRAPDGTSVFRADLLRPLSGLAGYAFIALFKPPGETPEQRIGEALVHLVAALQPGGYLLIVLAEHTDIESVLAALARLDVALLTSEPNALRTNIEPEHKWVILCQAAAPSGQGVADS